MAGVCCCSSALQLGVKKNKKKKAEGGEGEDDMEEDVEGESEVEEEEEEDAPKRKRIKLDKVWGGSAGLPEMLHLGVRCHKQFHGCAQYSKHSAEGCGLRTDCAR